MTAPPRPETLIFILCPPPALPALLNDTTLPNRARADAENP